MDDKKKFGPIFHKLSFRDAVSNQILVPYQIIFQDIKKSETEVIEKIINRKLGKHILNIPHKRMHNRNFVLFPLYEIDKDWVHPKLNKNIVILMSNLTSDQLLGIKIAQ